MRGSSVPIGMLVARNIPMSCTLPFQTSGNVFGSFHLLGEVMIIVDSLFLGEALMLEEFLS